MQGIAYAYNALSPATSSYHLVQQIAATEGPLSRDVPFFSIQTYEQTLPFYLDRTVTLVEYRDEFGFGLEQEPALAIADIESFKSRWIADKDAFAITSPDGYKLLTLHEVPMRVIARDPERIILSKP